MFGGGPMLHSIAVFAYAALLLTVIAMMVELRWEPRSPMLAGMLVGSATIAVLLGLVLLPFSAFGILFYGLGLLGLLPFAAAWTYGRRGGAIWRRTLAAGSRRHHHWRFALGLVMLLGLPIASQWLVTRLVSSTVAALVAGDDAHGARLARLRPIGAIVATQPFILAYEAHTDARVRQRLERAYGGLTGSSLPEDMVHAD